MTMAFSLVAACRDYRFFRRDSGINKELRNRMFNVAKELVAFTTEDNSIGCSPALCKKISPPLTISEDFHSGNVMFYVMTYNHNCEMLIGNMHTAIFVN
jgi:hypothetical protein